MQISPQISFRHMAYSPAIATVVREKVSKLERFYSRITSCRVIIEPSNRRRQQGNLYHIRVEVTVPGADLVASRDPSEHLAHEDIYVSIQDSFDAIRRQIEDYVRIHFRGKQRHRETPPHAWVAKLFPYEDYGFLETADGREIYFHRNSVLNKHFDDLKIGTEVRFAEEQGEKGPQASTVDLVGKEGKHRKIA